MTRGILGLIVFSVATPSFAAENKKIGYDDTPMQPDGRWHLHDGKRPQPRVVTPGARASSGLDGPPSDALVLIGAGNDVSQWRTMDGAAATWPIKDGVLESGKGKIRTKDEFSDFQLHVEFQTPAVIKGEGQGRGNSGVFLLGQFEIQILDSHDNPTYPDGQAAAMYGQVPPLVNASRKPGEWQTYDIVCLAPRFKDGKLDRPTVVTVFHNGVVVHHATAFFGPTMHRKIGEYSEKSTKGPVVLQDHGNPVYFRNMWLRPMKGYDAR